MDQQSTIKLIFLLIILSMIEWKNQANGFDVVLMDSPGKLQKFKKCEQTKYNSMLLANCNSLGLKEIPQNVNTDIEILLLADNKFPTIEDSFLKQFEKLSYISFEDNGILNISPGAFSHQENLIQLNLNRNLLTKLHYSIFDNKKLRKLFLWENKLMDDNFNLTIYSDLELLHLGNNQLTKVPQLINFNLLEYLNISGNKIVSFRVEDIAGFCSLKVLDISKNLINLEACDCQELMDWIKIKNIKLFSSFYKCGDCKISSFSNKTLEMFDKCKIKVSAKKKELNTKKIIKYSAFVFGGTLLIVFLIFLYVTKRIYKKTAQYKIEEDLSSQDSAL